jgi:hypothetical protein
VSLYCVVDDVLTVEIYIWKMTYTETLGSYNLGKRLLEAFTKDEGTERDKEQVTGNYLQRKRYCIIVYLDMIECV